MNTLSGPLFQGGLRAKSPEPASYFKNPNPVGMTTVAERLATQSILQSKLSEDLDKFETKYAMQSHTANKTHGLFEQLERSELGQLARLMPRKSLDEVKPHLPKPVKARLSLDSHL